MQTPKRPTTLADLRPADTPEYMTPAWLGCINFAIGQPEIVAAFRRETGINWEPGKTGLDRMIDDAVGADWRFIEAFVYWVNVNVWGPIDAGTNDQ